MVGVVGSMSKSGMFEITCSTMPDFDILCGGFPCFVAGTKVLTHTDYKNIEDITYASVHISY